MPRHRRRRTTSVFSFTSASSSSSSSSDIDEDDNDAVSSGASTSKTQLLKVKTKIAATATANNRVTTKPDRSSTPPKNILLKILHRERSSFLSGGPSIRCNQQQLAAVPHGLSFCLQDIVPFCYLTGHVFMGLTLCGQFLLSYKETVVETTDFTDFCIGSFKYELFFWIYRPHQLLRKYYSRCLFDNRGADNEVRVTMCQWPGRPRTLVVHGSCKYEHEDSYVSVVAVPRLGCLDCRRLRDRLPCSPDNAPSRSAALCIGCNLTVHTKYTRAESDPPFEPRINLNCPDRLILFSNGLIHMLNVSLHLDRPPTRRRQSACLDVRYLRRKTNVDVVVRVDGDGIGDVDIAGASSIVSPTNVLTNHSATTAPDSLTTPPPPSSGTKPADIVAQIIADFDEYDSNNDAPAVHDMSTATVTAPSPPKLMTTEYFEQLVLGTLPSSATTTATTVANDLVTSLAPRAVAELRRTSSAASLRWITRLSAAAATASVAPATTTSSSTTSTTSAYDFADEPPERYEKISSYRKRRLADKKYEFSEDNSENIIPFAKLRMRRMQSMLMMMPPSVALSGADGSSPTTTTTVSMVAGSNHSPHHQHHSQHHHHHYLHQHAHHQQPNGGGGSQSPLSDGGQGMQPTPHTHRASPSHGFRSPCGSPVGGNRFTAMSPPMLSVGGSFRSGASSSSSAAVAGAIGAGGSASAGTPTGTATAGGGSSAGCGLFGRSPTYIPFGSSPRYVKRFEQNHGCSGTIYSPLLLSPRSDGDYEVYRLSGGGTSSAPLAEVKPSNIFTTATSSSVSISSSGLHGLNDPLAKETQHGYAHTNAAVPPSVVTAAASAAQQITLVSSSSTVTTELPTTTTAAAVADEEAATNTLQPICVKKLIRCFVARKMQIYGEGNDDNDDDDRTSVLTSDEDDDCISPGYHTSLPVAVHGACYANMLQVSAGRLQLQQQRNDDDADVNIDGGGDATGDAVVQIKQHTFDLESLTYHVANHLCSLHDKQYGSFYDWACEPIHICPLSDILVSLLMVNFTARDATQPGAAPCLNCANGDRLDCAFHRRHFESRSLFAWNVRNTEWNIIDYGDLAELTSDIHQRARGQPDVMVASPTTAVESVDGSVSDEGSSTTTAPTTTTLAANAAFDGAHDLAARARRWAIELRATLPSTQTADDGQRSRKRDGGGRIFVRNSKSNGAGRVDDGVGWSLAGLHTLDSCTDRSKEFLRDQYNAIEFVRDAVADRGGASGVDGNRGNYLIDLNATSSSSSSDNSDWE